MLGAICGISGRPWALWGGNSEICQGTLFLGAAKNDLALEVGAARVRFGLGDQNQVVVALRPAARGVNFLRI